MPKDTATVTDPKKNAAAPAKPDASKPAKPEATGDAPDLAAQLASIEAGLANLASLNDTVESIATAHKEQGEKLEALSTELEAVKATAKTSEAQAAEIVAGTGVPPVEGEAGTGEETQAEEMTREQHLKKYREIAATGNADKANAYYRQHLYQTEES